MFNIMNLVGENQQHLFTEEQVLRHMSDKLKAMEGGFLIPEPVAIYLKPNLEKEYAFLVKRGPGPHKWITKITPLIKALHSEGERVLLTRGEYESRALFKSISTNISRKHPNASRRTFIGISNLSGESSGRISHHIFQLMEVIFDDQQ